MARKKNAAAVKLAKLRAKKLSPARRLEISQLANQAKSKKLTPERRREIARAGAAARWGG